MSPYELRFEIFKQAYCMLSDKFAVENETAIRWNEDRRNQVPMDYPEFPTLENVLEQSEVINTFVSDRR